MAFTPAQRLIDIANLFFLRDRLREARARLPAPETDRARALNQARLLLEVGRRVVEPVEALPVGAPNPIQIGLYADAVYWALVARAAKPQPGVPFATLWESARNEGLLKARESDAETITAVQSLVFDRPPGGNLASEDQSVGTIRRFAEALVWELEAPARRIESLLVNRWLRLALMAAVLVGAWVGVRSLLIGPNLIANRPFQTSSALELCAHKGACGDLLFHTQQQDNPWAEFDIGSVKPVHRVELTNRSDCCAERIAGVVVELSIDHQTWTEVARNEQVFARWTPTFTTRPARYVRVRLPRPNIMLHLDDVAVR